MITQEALKTCDARPHPYQVNQNPWTGAQTSAFVKAPPGIPTGRQGSEPHIRSRRNSARTQGERPQARAQVGVWWRQTPYLVGLGLHGHHRVQGDHEDHHSHPGQDGGAQVLRKESRQRFTQASRAEPPLPLSQRVRGTSTAFTQFSDLLLSTSAPLRICRSP